MGVLGTAQAGPLDARSRAPPDDETVTVAGLRDDTTYGLTVAVIETSANESSQAAPVSVTAEDAP